MKRIICIIFLVALLFGCATFPVPQISGNIYTDEKHSLQFTVPGGWQVSQKLPEVLEKELQSFPEEVNILYMFSKEYRGYMMLIAFRKENPVKGKRIAEAGPNARAFINRTMLDSLKKSIPKQVALGEWVDHGNFVIIPGTASYDALDFYVGIRFKMYDCQEDFCSYTIVNMSLMENGEQNEKLLKTLDIVTK